MKTLKLLGTSALLAAIAAPAFASGPDAGDAFTVTFNGRTELSITYSDDIADELDMNNQYTRFGFTANGDTALGAFTAKLEGDFATSSGTFRVRHAYGQVGPILAGQTDSLMRTGLPYVSDWGWSYFDAVSTGNNWGRRQQLRYTTSMGDAKVAVAIEENGVSGNDFFDITGNVQFSVGPAAVTVAAVHEPDGDTAVGAAASFSIGPADAFVTMQWSDGATGFYGALSSASLASTTGDNFGIGGGFYVSAGDNLTAFLGASSMESGDDANAQDYLTASLTWSPMPQYSIIGQVHIIDETVSNTVTEATVFENRWMYKF